MSVEALWSVVFYAGNTQMGGGGIIVLETGRVLGGDIAYTFLGDYEVASGRLKARVTVSKYQNVPGIQNVTGLDNYVGIFEGAVADQQMRVSGYVQGRPEIQINAILTRRAELPNPA
jgi:hypothetical protein